MIYKIVKGRLGNQMFQYAAMRSMQLKYFPNENMQFYFKLVEKKGDKKDGFTNTLKDFKIIENIETKKIKMNLLQNIKIIKMLILNFIIKKKNKSHKEYVKKLQAMETKKQKNLNKNGVFWYTKGYYNYDFSNIKAKNKIFYGYYESKRYLEGDIKNVLKEEFSPKYEKLEENKELYSIIENNNSVCVSIRRGDFITNPNYKKNHYICDENYFREAIDIMNKKIKNPKYVIFSDDIDWVKQNMKFPRGTVYESGKDPVWEKLRLMYNCKHYIISNSSFSWWAQYLSRNNEHKIVIAPKKWLNNSKNPDIYEDNWILI